MYSLILHSEVSYNYGWAIISLTLLNIGINQMVMLVSVGHKLYKLAKKGYKMLKEKCGKKENTAQKCK
jgi:hypothetical protein